MGTRRLAFSPLQAIALEPVNSETLHIEIPEGESHYHFSQIPGSAEEAHFVFHLRHPHSRLLITGMVMAAGETGPRLSTQVIHHVPETRAETVIRTLAYDASQPHYEGLITIEEDAQNCESYLNHHSLLLGDTAKSWTLPSLEIKADQVKCSHAATLRTITELDLFYARSRGLTAAEATAMHIEAFLSDVKA
ncbi:MAG: SufD protein rane protein Fe-S cluster assembly protein SufD [Patescibacteria group bacterium]|jgi:Fe-S cluster assembly protein SufD|nr:SufD protein rane protein Fe-S cluster assembly protein SufD [Patescibacteria group bacterium]